MADSGQLPTHSAVESGRRAWFGKSHSRSIGDIERLRPWRETTYYLGPRLRPFVLLVHWDEPKLNPLSSHLGEDERHTWRLYLRGIPATFIVRCGAQEEVR